MFNPIFSFHKKPLLTLVGAGPGDPELITLKALKTLEAADIVLYDALVSKEILSYIPASTPVICVGKRAGLHSPRSCTDMLFASRAEIRLYSGALRRRLSTRRAMVFRHVWYRGSVVRLRFRPPCRYL